MPGSTYAADSSLLLIAEQTADSAEKSVDLTRQRLEGGIAPRTDLGQAEQILPRRRPTSPSSGPRSRRTSTLLQLLVGAPIDPSSARRLDRRGVRRRSPPSRPGSSSYVLLRRPDVLQAEYQLRAANAEIGAARAALFPRITLTGLLGFASSALASLFTGGAFGFSAGANAAYTIFQAGAGRANVRLTEAQRNAALANYQKAVQTAFREVADALARRGDDGRAARRDRRQQAAAADVYTLEEQRYRAGIDAYLNLLDRPAVLLFGPAGAGPDQADGRPEPGRCVSIARWRFPASDRSAVRRALCQQRRQRHAGEHSARPSLYGVVTPTGLEPVFSP